MIGIIKKYLSLNTNSLFKNAEQGIQGIIHEDEMKDRYKRVIESVSYEVMDFVLLSSLVVAPFTSLYLPIIAILFVISATNVMKHSKRTKRAIWYITKPARLSNSFLFLQIILIGLYTAATAEFLKFSISEAISGLSIVVPLSILFTRWRYFRYLEIMNNMPPIVPPKI